MAGDVLMAVGEPDRIRQFARTVGEQVSVDASSIHSQIQVQWITVSRKQLADRTFSELAFDDRFDVQVTRVRRSGVEIPPLRNVRLHLGDEIRVVGLPKEIAKIAFELGDSRKKLDEPDILPIFLGITLGVIVGSIPFSIPGISGSIKLGLAGGPLLVAIVLSRVHRIGPLVWYLPRSSNMTLRDIGIAVFLASVRLKSGDRFVETLIQGSGLLWFAVGADHTRATTNHWHHRALCGERALHGDHRHARRKHD